jgi:single-stranded-DNA-specific exonuclease
LPRIEVDAQLNFSEIGIATVRELEALKPFGVGNPEPVFMTMQVEVCERKLFSAGARFRLRQGPRVISGVAFGADEDVPGIPGTIVDVAYRLSENEWNGTSTVELKLVDIRPAAGN